ncbi:MAG: hypothetical protein LBO08_00605 [Rickettsiales bacterium]|jgi:hypothetical protein|nr:hypothetical protein [Rickettsiales bacterium]
MILKLVLFTAVLCIVLYAPVFLGAKNKKDKTALGMIRISSWLFGWTGFGYLFALWLAVRK